MRRVHFHLASLIVGSVLALAGCSRVTAPALVYSLENADRITEEFQYGAGGASGGGANPLEDPNRAPRWATVKGTVRVEGSVPAGPAVSPDKDQGVCGASIPNQVVMLGPNNALQNFLIFLNTELPASDADADEPVWVHAQYSYAKHPNLQEVEFDQKKCVFLSHVFVMRADQKLKILNSDPVAHNTKLDTRRATALNETIGANGHTYYEPKEQEDAPFPVSCTIHTWMGAWMITRNNPYFAVSGADGSFEIKHIPAGVELEYRVWHEKAQYLKGGELKVMLDGNTVNMDKGRFKLKLGDGMSPETSHVLELVVGSSALQ